MGSVSPRCRLHRSWRGSSSRAAPGVDAPGQRRTAQAAVELHLDVGTEVEGKADVVTAAVDLVDDVDAARRPVQPDRAAVPGRRAKRQVAVVLSGPLGDVAAVARPRSPGRSHDAATGRARRRRTGPAHPARWCCARWWSGNMTATQVRRGSSTCPDRRGCPRRRSRTSTDRASAWACAAMLRYPCGPPSQRHQISGPPSPVRPQQRYPGIGEPRRPRHGPALRCHACAPARPPMIVLAASGRHRRPPVEPAEQRIAERQQ